MRVFWYYSLMQTKQIILPIIVGLLLCGGGYFALHKTQATGSEVATTTDKTLESLQGTADAQTQNPDAAAQAQSTQPVQTPITKSESTKSIMEAILHTNKGDITIVFNPETPNTVANFIKLAQSGFYDGTKFHRVIKDFMSQGGDPLSKDDTKSAQWGTGGPGYQFADEITATNSNDVGTIAMANAGPNTNGSQFFINAAPNHFLDTKHTVFGKVVVGLDVAKAINHVATAPGDRPLEPVVLQSITLK